MMKPLSSPNKIVARKVDERNKIIEERRLQHIKCSVDQETPATFRTIRVNRKRMQQKEERAIEIERENKILLDKMTRIMNVPKSPTQQKEFRIKSLNRDLRKRELVRIAVENQSILKRLQEKKSSYDRNEWIEYRKKTEYYLKNISQFPVTARSHVRSPTSPRDQLESQLSERVKSRNLLHRKSETMQGLTIYTDTRPPFDNSTSLYNGNDSTKNSTPLAYALTTRVNSMATIDHAKTMLYQTTKTIGFNKFLIQFYYQNRMFKIVAFNQFITGLKVFSCPQDEGKELLKKFEYNYPAIIERIHFQGNAILIGQEDMLDNSEENRKEELPQEIHQEQQENSNGEKQLNRTIQEEEDVRDSPNVLQQNLEAQEGEPEGQKALLEDKIEDHIEDKIEGAKENIDENEQKGDENDQKGDENIPDGNIVEQDQNKNNEHLVVDKQANVEEGEERHLEVEKQPEERNEQQNM